ncbi:hypothetical protein R1sor_027062 [Riccia sorocarpa]|uniref:Uncharacterized protein n=1 Tax=Riccia sorocarpa TaxID=122646 RepID=A0ABD3GFA2_9MARC
MALCSETKASMRTFVLFRNSRLSECTKEDGLTEESQVHTPPAITHCEKTECPDPTRNVIQATSTGSSRSIVDDGSRVRRKKRMEELVHLMMNKETAITSASSEKNPVPVTNDSKHEAMVELPIASSLQLQKLRPVPVESPAKRYKSRKALSFWNCDSRQVPEPQPTYSYPLGSSYPSKLKSPLLSVKAEIAASPGGSLTNSESRRSIHSSGSSSIDFMHKRIFAANQSLGHHLSNPSGLSSHMGSVSPEDKAGKTSNEVPKLLPPQRNLLYLSESPALNFNANIPAGRKIWSSETGPTNGGSSMDVEHSSSVLDRQTVGHQFGNGNPAELSSYSLPGYLDEGKALKALFHQTVVVEKPKESFVDPSLLRVKLFKHQRIALHWMEERETKNGTPFGGILADDQGLGKSMSTISLMLKARAPIWNQEAGSPPCVDGEGMLAGGTLVVCPTSVLRQWANELNDKVTEAAGLSVLIYHGSCRTRDTRELAKFDVVITSYGVLSTEVPNLHDDYDVPLSRKKRKRLEVTRPVYFGPLSRVKWFRVVLDEAQSIKNSRTRVARAAWGLKAQRRWCLSGTPIQNTIEDLFSYFRFLRFDPYDGFKTFCQEISGPINRTPEVGYKALQVLLSTVMLRRTKDTLIDGEPIVKLPPRIVAMEEVEFDEEEREFYSDLEYNSREKYEDYADAGTVTRNYYNILVMILRLRQACNHRLLVKGQKTQRARDTDVDSARSLPLELRTQLLILLETSNTICPLCNDTPDDSVVCICTHIFCWECILQHLAIGDSNCCPVPNCKKQLKLSSIFTAASLKSCDGVSESGTAGAVVADGTQEDGRKPDETEWRPSSKINAVMAKLNALPKISLIVENGMVVAEINENADDVNLPNASDRPPSEAAATTDANILPSNLTADIYPCSSSQGLPTSTSATQAPNASGSIVNEADPMKSKDAVTKVIKTTEKAIVFSQWTSMLNLLEISLKKAKFNYRRLDGTMSLLARERAVAEFKSLPEVTVIIMSLKAASLGLNMVAACHVLMLDVWWNPTTEDQAIDRAHRIGQKKTVRVTRFTIPNTIEDRILDLQERKKNMVASAFGDGQVLAGGLRLSEADIQYLFRA